MRYLVLIVVFFCAFPVLSQKTISASQFLNEIDQKQEFSLNKNLNDIQSKQFIADNASLLIETIAAVRNGSSVVLKELDFAKKPTESLETLIKEAQNLNLPEAFVLENLIEVTKDKLGEEAAEKIIKINPLKVGLGVGINQALDPIKEVTYSPVDSIVHLRKIKRTSFVISSTLSFEIFSGARKVRNLDPALKENGSQAQDSDKVGKILSKGQIVKQAAKDGTPTYLFKPNGWNLLLSINLATFESAATKAPEFNLRVNGGIGIGYSINSHVQVGLLAEFTKRRQPYNHFKDIEGQKLDDSYPNSVITLDKTDDNLYFTDYVPSLSLKVVILPFELFKDR